NSPASRLQPKAACALRCRASARRLWRSAASVLVGRVADGNRRGDARHRRAHGAFGCKRDAGEFAAGLSVLGGASQHVGTAARAARLDDQLSTGDFAATSNLRVDEPAAAGVAGDAARRRAGAGLQLLAVDAATTGESVRTG